MPTFFDLLKYAKTGLASPDMTAYDKAKALAMCGGGLSPYTIIGQPPISFKSDGTPLTSVTIKGNGVQNGTPSPQNIVPFDGTGERTGNLFDTDLTRYHMGKASNNAIGRVTNGAMFCIKAVQNATYTIKIYTLDSTFVRLYLSDAPIVEGVSETYSAISESESTTNPEVTITNTNHTYLWIQTGGTWYTEHGGSSIMLNLGSTALPYEPYGYKIPLTCASQTTPLYLGEVSTTRRIKKLVLTGEETIGYSTSGINARTYTALTDVMASSTAFSTHYALGEIRNYPLVGEFCINSAGALIFGVDINTITSADDFKQYLRDEYSAGHPVVVWYVLADSQTGIVNEPLYRIGDYCDELTTTTLIPTARGSNELTVDTTVQPSEVSITGNIKPTT